MKLLGFHFDGKPSADAHVKVVPKKVRYRTWAIHNLKRLGLSPPALIMVYKSLVRPCFDYASVVYHSLLTKTMSEALEKQQRKILKIIYGFDVSYASALKQADLERLDVRRCTLRERFVIKLSNNPRFSEWIPLNETPVYSFRHSAKYVEFPFRTERLRDAPLYAYHHILNFLDSENNGE